MTEDLTRLFVSVAADLDRTIAGITPDQLGAATPCDGWDVRTLLNHLVGGNAFFLSRATGTPGPSRADDFIGGDALGAFRDSVARLVEVFSAEGFATRPVSTPFGDGVGATLVTMRINEFLLHGWDLAVATGQPREFDPGVLAFAERAFHGLRIPRGKGDGVMFDAPQQVPEGASALDALAAFMGRRVPA